MTATDAPPASSTSANVAKKKNKPWLLWVIIALVVSGAWFAISAFQSQAPLELSGLVQAHEIKNASRFGGRVLQVFVKEGDKVKTGQLMLRFDDIDLKSKIADAQAALTEAKARRSLLLAGADRGDLKQASARVEQANQQLKLISQGASVEQLAQAQTALESAKLKLQEAESANRSADRMVDEGIISRQKYQEIGVAYEAAKSQYSAAEATLKTVTRGARPEDVRIAKAQLSGVRAQYQQLARGAKQQDLEIANAAVSQAESTLNALKSQLSEVTLKAPFDGVVSTLSVSEGELVAPGRPVLTIINPDDLWTDVYVPEARLADVQENQLVKVVPVVMPNLSYSGKISSISTKSEFVPDGQGSKGSESDEQASFKVKVVVDGAQAGQWKTEKAAKKAGKPVYLRPGMTVHVVLE